MVTRYADDTILGFQYQTDADRFLENWRERLAKFGLELHADKSRRIEFGRFAEENRRRRGEGKAETFDFLRFTHISGKNSLGRFMVRRKTIRKRIRGKLRKIKQQLRMRMHDPLPQTGRWLQSVVQGHFNYYAVPGNLASLGAFRDRVLALWWRTLRRRSQKQRISWTRTLALAQRWLPLRFDYGTVVPWVTRLEDNRLCAVAGPDRIVFYTTVALRGENLKTRADFEVEEGQTVPFALTWSHSFGSLPSPPDAAAVVEGVTDEWKKWSSKHAFKGPYAEATLRSVITLKALTHHETGGIVAAATTSLPEQIGGIRNWDYRFCWIRDAAYTLYALMGCGFMDEAEAWRDWLLRAVAGKPDRIQIMYGIAGERRLTEFELAELSGYEASRPVRIGNAASGQQQLDVYGELLDSAYLARHKGLRQNEAGWELGRALVNHLEQIWTEPDAGIWEIRGPQRHFVHSKVMAWLAFDRAVRMVQEFGVDGPLDRWVRLRSDIHDEVCSLGFSRELNSFVQYYGSKELDASLLLLPLVGFLPPEDHRIQGTVAAIEKNLMQDGLVARYDTRSSVDGLVGNEGAFLACSFWMVDNYVLQGLFSPQRQPRPAATIPPWHSAREFVSEAMSIFHQIF